MKIVNKRPPFQTINGGGDILSITLLSIHRGEFSFSGP